MARSSLVKGKREKEERREEKGIKRADEEGREEETGGEGGEDHSALFKTSSQPEEGLEQLELWTFAIAFLTGPFSGPGAPDDNDPQRK